MKRIEAILTPERLAALMRKLISGSQFATIGALGLVVNQVLLWLLYDVIHFQHLLIAAAIATQGSTTFNFIGTESWVFSHRRPGGWKGVVTRFLAYDAVNSSVLLLRLPALQVLTAGLHANYLMANLITLVAFTLLRFLIADSVIWPGRAQSRRVM